MNNWLSGPASLCALLMAGSAMAQAPKMTQAQARLLYAAGGFPISADGRNPTNRCGKAASPRITFVDMNGDRRKEALFIDSGACYQPDGRWYAVATQDADGSWRRVLEGPGTVQANGAITNGWFALNVTSAGKMQTLTYDGRSYAPKTAAADAKPMAAQSPAARDTAIFRAAGFKQMRGQWESGCNDPSVSAFYEPGRIEQVKDINGDGRPDAIVTEGGTFCYGNTGTAFWLVSQQADGSWKLLYSEIGIAEFLTTRGVGGWPDISVGGPGFCFPVMRWNGKEYVRNRFAYDGKPCRPPSF